MGVDSRAKSVRERPAYLNVCKQHTKWLTINDHSSWLDIYVLSGVYIYIYTHMAMCVIKNGVNGHYEDASYNESGVLM